MYFFYGEFAYLFTFIFIDTFHAAKKLIPRAVQGTDINTGSEADENQYGKGKRVKRPRIVYSPAPQESEREIDSTGDEQCQHTTVNLNIPPPPKDLASNFKQSCTINFLLYNYNSISFIHDSFQCFSLIQQWHVLKANLLQVAFTLPLN